MNEKHLEKLKRRGAAIAKMRLVRRISEREIEVFTPSLRGHQTKQTVFGDWQAARCTCLEYEAANDRNFFCEHKWAVYYAANGLVEV